jgi:hypothetical protein
MECVEASYDPLPPPWCGENGITEPLKKRFLALQHVLVIVDAKKHRAVECGTNRCGHRSLSKTHFQQSEQLFTIALARRPEFPV